MRTEFVRLHDDKYLRAMAGLPFLLTTALEYQNACNGADNNAGAAIDRGLEPYVISTDALDLGTHPYIPVWDVSKIVMCHDGVELSLAGREHEVPKDTLLAWR